jgi:hypothetical protein
MEFKPFRINFVFGIDYVLDSINPSNLKAHMGFWASEEKLTDVLSGKRLGRFLSQGGDRVNFFLKVSWKNINDRDDFGGPDNPPSGIICDGLDPCASRQPSVTTL